MKKVCQAINRIIDYGYKNAVEGKENPANLNDESKCEEHFSNIRNAILSDVSSPDKPLLMISLGVSALSLRNSVNKLKEEEQEGIGNVSHALKEMGEELYRQLVTKGWTPPV